MTTYITTLRDAACTAGLRPGSLGVLMAIAHHANKDSGIAWPGYALLMKHLDIKESALRKHIRALEATGWLVTLRTGSNASARGGVSNKYQLVVPEGDRPSGGKPPVVPAKQAAPVRPTGGKPPVVPPVRLAPLPPEEIRNTGWTVDAVMDSYDF